ncbi:Calcineurin subunit B type 2 [Cucumispora dikerogammari]|nr:Calcineurin subunit B type 2 [Cucumispora dikerogammari]
MYNHLNSPQTLLIEELKTLTKIYIFNLKEIIKLYNRFKYLDKTNTGLLTASDIFLIPEFKSNPIGSCVIEVLELINDYNLFNFNSFLFFMEIFHIKSHINKRKQFFFKLLDRNNDGKICKEILKYFFLKMHGNNLDENVCKANIDFIINKYGVKNKEYVDFIGVCKIYLEFELEKLFVMRF